MKNEKVELISKYYFTCDRCNLEFINQSCFETILVDENSISKINKIKNYCIICNFVNDKNERWG